MTKPIDPASPDREPEASKPSQAPPPGGAAGVHAMRRGGARREVSERVFLKGIPDAASATGAGTARVLDGWALNVSRGGLRAILEEKVDLGERYEVTLGEGDLLVRVGRIVWVQEEPDGVIVGLEFVSTSGTHKSVPPPPPAPNAADAVDAASDDGEPPAQDR